MKTSQLFQEAKKLQRKKANEMIPIIKMRNKVLGQAARLRKDIKRIRPTMPGNTINSCCNKEDL